MSLKDRLTDDLKQAMRQGDERRKSTIRLVRAAITNAEIERGKELSDDEVLAVIAKQAKQRRESVTEFARGGRQDLVDQEEEELQILLSYLPAQMSRDDIEIAARQVIAEVGATSMAQMGEVMRRLMPQLKGKADGSLVNQVVKEILTGTAKTS
ncbi:MAG: GatB/YqeY domain-containing protein [Anaerolineae bacterium]